MSPPVNRCLQLCKRTQGTALTTVSFLHALLKTLAVMHILMTSTPCFASHCSTRCCRYKLCYLTTQSEPWSSCSVLVHAAADLASTGASRSAGCTLCNSVPSPILLHKPYNPHRLLPLNGARRFTGHIIHNSIHGPHSIADTCGDCT